MILFWVICDIWSDVFTVTVLFQGFPFCFDCESWEIRPSVTAREGETRWSGIKSGTSSLLRMDGWIRQALDCHVGDWCSCSEQLQPDNVHADLEKVFWRCTVSVSVIWRIKSPFSFQRKLVLSFPPGSDLRLLSHLFHIRPICWTCFSKYSVGE